MADTIPRYFTQERLETSRLPRAPVGIADVGAGIEALGLAGFGRILSGISSDALQNLLTVRSEAQELEGTSKWERAHTEFFTNLVKDQNFENYGKKYKAFAKSLRRQVLKKGLTGTARQNLEAYIENQQVGQEKKVAAAFLAKQRDFGRVSAFQSVINFEQAGDFDGAVSAINHARNVGFMSAEEAFIRKQKVQANIANYQKQALLNSVHEAAKTMPYTNAISYLNDLKGITSAERNDLIRRRERQNEIETATTNPKVRWDTLRKLQKDPRTVTDDYLEGLVGKGLTWDDAEEFKKIRDTKIEPLKTPRAQLYFNRLDALYDKRDTDADEAYEWDIANEKLTAFFKRNPDATANEAKEAYENITDEKKQGFIKELLDRVLWRKGAGRVIKETIFGKPEKPIREPVKIEAGRRAKIRTLVVPLNLKYKTRLQPSLLDNASKSFFDTWSKLDDDRKIKALQALENGYSEQEILTALE